MTLLSHLIYSETNPCLHTHPQTLSDLCGIVRFVLYVFPSFFAEFTELLVSFRHK